MRIEEGEPVSSAGLGVDIVPFEESFPDRRHGPRLPAEVPDPGADGVQTRVWHGVSGRPFLTSGCADDSRLYHQVSWPARGGLFLREPSERRRFHAHRRDHFPRASHHLPRWDAFRALRFRSRCD
jgi:hypothetical protein